MRVQFCNCNIAVPMGEGIMEKLFWGMVGLCTIAFAFLLGMYLNQSGVLNFSAAEETTTVASEEHPED